MPEQIDELRKKIEESRKKEKKDGQTQPEEEAVVDPKAVEKIVAQMKKKYKSEGVEIEEGQNVRELRNIIGGADSSKISTQPVEELIEVGSPFVSTLGKTYFALKLLIEPLVSVVKRFPISKELAYYIYSADMKYSVKQYLALSVTIASLSFLFSLAFGVIASFLFGINILLAFGVSIGVFFMALIVVLMIPKTIAQQMGSEINKELPFALRHMSAELRAGIGLYKTLETIATSDYGLLSKEFTRTINEIEEGTDTQEALRHFALRTQSKSLRNALFHIIRALKTGGALSQVMNQIAEDVSFDLQLSIRDFAEKMNFFGVIFIFGAIVIPVFMAIIGTILNAPLGVPIGGVSLPPQVLILCFAVIFPFILGIFVYYLKMIQPSV